MLDRVSSAAFTLLWVTGTALMAAEPTEATVGDKVRIRFEHGSTVGILRALDERTLSLEQLGTGAATIYSLGSVRGVEVSRGERMRGGNVKKGALIGGAIGAVVGVVSNVACSGEGEGCGGAWIPIVGGVLGVIGAGMGAGIGATLPPSESWRSARLKGLQLSLEPVARGAQLRVAFGF